MGILDLSIAVPNFQGEEIMVQRDVMSFSKYHKHQFVEIAYFYHGTGRHIIDGEVFDVKAGDIFVLNSGVFHQFKGDDLRVINVMFSASFISSRKAGFFARAAALPFAFRALCQSKPTTRW